MLVRKCFILCLLFLVGCATPPEVKQLSVKQNEYFDAAIAAVAIQSDALILATEKLVEQSKKRISDEEEVAIKRTQDLMVKNAQTEANAKKIANDLAKTTSATASSHEKLDRDLASIKQKILELGLFLEKMKEVNITLDSYIQSEKAGEAVVRDIMNQPSVKSLLNSVSVSASKVQVSAQEINSMVKNTK